MAEVEKTGYKLKVHIKDFWPGQEDAEFKDGSKALFYRGINYIETVDLDAKAKKAVEIEFRECRPEEVLRIYFMDKEVDDINEPDFSVSFNIKEHFCSGKKMVNGQTYETNMALYDHEDDDCWNGVYGEHDFEMNGEMSVIQTAFTLNNFTYKVKEEKKKARAGRASRSPQRARETINNKNAVATLMDLAKHNGKSNIKEVFSEKALEAHECSYDAVNQHY